MKMNNDLISRADLWKKVVSHRYPVDILENEHKVITEILMLIDSAPTALFPLTFQVGDKVTDEDIETIKRLMKDYKPQILHLETERSQVDLIRRSKAIEELNYLKHIGYDNSGVMKLQNMEIQRCISAIEDVPAEDISGSEYFPYRTAYFNGVKDGEATAQGELAEKLKDRIEESVCKHCQMNKHCELCEVSRVFQIIMLTAEDQKLQEELKRRTRE